MSLLKGNTGLYKWLWRNSKGLRFQSILNTSISIIRVGMDFAFISATKWAIDIATGRQDDDLRWAAAILIGIMCCNILIAFSRRWIAAILGVKAQNRIQLHIFEHLMQSTWNGLEPRHSGDVLNRLERDVQDVTEMLTETIPALLAILVRLVGAFLFLNSMDTRLACLLVCISPAFILLSKLYMKKMRSITREIRTTDSRIQSVLQESIQHRVILKTLEKNRMMTSKLSNLQQALQGQIQHRTLFASLSGLLLNTGFSAGYIVTFLWGAYNLKEGLITYGTMLAFIQLVGQIQGPFRELTRFIPLIVSTLTASERLMELDQTPLEEDGPPIKFPEGAGIRLSDVSYTYEKGKRTILQHLSYDFPIGSITAIMGETGAGKTTLIRLILALLKPTSGNVEIYDEKRRVSVCPMTRCNLIYVPQGNTLFSGTIRENLLLGNPQATEEQLKNALRTACAEFVLQLPLGLDSRCGEMGSGLSEGQSQRIAIARALLRDGNILLLDEATSALDPDTERELLQNLTQYHENKHTILFITHRLMVAEYCTQTLTLKKEG